MTALVMYRARDADGLEREVELTARGIDEHAPRAVRAVARHLAEEYELGIAAALAEDDLGRRGVQVTAAAVLGRRRERLQRATRGKERRRAAGLRVPV